MKPKTIASLILSCAGVGQAAWAQVAPPPLTGLPGTPGPHIAQIEAMPKNSWLRLDGPAADPAYGRCTGRSWGARAAYSPALRAAFYYGEAMHGWWNDVTRRYYDTLWAYDIMGNRWICLYPGANVDTLTLTLDGNGFEVDASGQPIPVAQNVHGYEMLAFDTDRRKFCWMSCPGGYDTVLDPRRNLWGTGHGYRPSNCSPWMYDVASGKFQLQKTAPGAPGGGFGDTLVYIPSLKKFWFKKGGQPDPDAWFYDPAANTWTGITAPGPKPPFGIDSTCCLDTKRNRIYIGGGSYPVASGSNAFWIFDLNTNTWIDPQPSGSPGNSYATAYAFMNYDSVDDVVILVKHTAKELHIYDPKTNSWSQPSGAVPGISNVNAFYDPGLNVVFAHNAGDNREGEMWVYRYGDVPPAGPAPTPTPAPPPPTTPPSSATPAGSRSPDPSHAWGDCGALGIEAALLVGLLTLIRRR
jgi:hypothetical protein